MKTIYLIRHSESEHNKSTMHIIGGHLDDSPLTQHGEMQSYALGERLASEGIKFDRIYSSTYKRAMKTADIVSERLGYDIAKIIRRKELIEYGHGDFAGRLRSEVYTPELKRHLDNNSWKYVPPGGESQAMVAKRMYSVIDDEILGKQVGEDNENREYKENFSEVDESIGIFTHGTAIRCLLRKIMWFDPRHIYRMDIKNTSITELMHDADGWHVNRINDYAHLNNMTR